MLGTQIGKWRRKWRDISLVFLAVCLPIYFGTSVPRVSVRGVAAERALLQSIGTPASIVEQLPDDAVHRLYRDLYDEYAVYCGEGSKTESEGDIKTDDLRIWVLPYKTNCDGTELLVHIVSVWQHNPIIKRVDAMVCNWDSEQLELAENAGDFYAESRYYDTISKRVRIYESCGAPAVIASGGIGYYWPLANFTTGICDINGSASFRLTMKEPLKTEFPNTALHIAYVHAQNPARIGPTPVLRTETEGVTIHGGLLSSEQFQRADIRSFLSEIPQKSRKNARTGSDGLKI